MPLSRQKNGKCRNARTSSVKTDMLNNLLIRPGHDGTGTGPVEQGYAIAHRL